MKQKKLLIKLAPILVIILISVLISGCSSTKANNGSGDSGDPGATADTQTGNQADTQADNEEGATEEEMESDASDNPEDIIKVEITIEDGGVIALDLDKSKAPLTVANFVSLASDGFYDGLTFHRIIPGFMIQGGDPSGDGTGGTDNKVKGEFESNGVTNNISHKRGVISMARRGDSMDSASCQFFITNADSTFLDGDYAAFGFVTSGMDVVDRISAVETGANDKPIEDVVIKSIKVVQ